MKWPIIVAIILLFLGAAIVFCSLLMVRFDFKLFSAVQYEKKEQTIGEAFTDIAVEAKNYDVIVAPSETGSAYIEYDVPMGEESDFSASVKDGKLTVTVQKNRKWYKEWSLFGHGSPVITLYLPKGLCGVLDVSLTTGDVCVKEGFSFTALNVDVTTGDIDVNATVTGAVTVSLTTGDGSFSGSFASLSVSGGSGDMELADLTVTLSLTTGDVEIKRTALGAATLSGTTGDIEALDLSVSGDMSVKRTTGDIELKNTIVGGRMEINGGSSDVYLRECDAATLYIEVTTGDVRGHLLTDKQYLATTTTGEVQVPRTAGPLCEIHTTTGDIDFLGLW